jgi:N-acetyl-1-D-myo-inositol-2-amino-2-deoxy-alpha-D-glucopyranoside deacetylase/mycothiol S-conjugate amidase
MVMPQRPRVLVFVGAHPDDETFGVGATLAHYAAAGAAVYYVCATRGEANPVTPEMVRGYDTPGDMRWAELEAAAEVLGLAGTTHLGYRDSGMSGWESNRHPMALTMAPVEDAAGRLVKILRDLKPHVVVTHDQIGGYGHPDHVAVHNITVRAFQAVSDARQFPEAGETYQPEKLYFHVFPRQMLQIAIRLLPLLGRDPRHYGQNGDVDLTALVAVNLPVDARVRLRRADRETRNRAVACYRSQTGSGPPRSGLLSLVNRLFGRHDEYSRAFPPRDGTCETDLFQV